MEKTIIVHANGKDTEIPVKASMKALLSYRAEFTGDLLKDLNEVYAKLHPDPFMEAIKKSGINPSKISRDELLQTVIENIDYASLDADGNAMPVLPDADTQIKAMQIIWTMAKTANGSTKRFDLWCDDMGLLPVADLIDRCYEIWQQANAGTIELKN